MVLVLDWKKQRKDDLSPVFAMSPRYLNIVGNTDFQHLTLWNARWKPFNNDQVILCIVVCTCYSCSPLLLYKLLRNGNERDIGTFRYLKFSAHSMAAWLFLFSLNTIETEKDQVIAFATTDCLWSAECACLFNVLAFQFLHSLPCFTRNLQVIKLSSDSKWSHSYWPILFRPHLLKITDC